MPTQFNQSFEDGDIIDDLHIKQLFSPVKEVEDGSAFFRDSTRSSSNYLVSFKNADNPDGHVISTLSNGQIIRFKADGNNDDPQFLQVQLQNNPTQILPLHLSGESPPAGFIKDDSIVEVVYNSEPSPRFEIIGLSRKAAKALDELDDVSLSTSPVNGAMLSFDGTDFVDQDQASIRTNLDVPSNPEMQAELALKSDVGHVHPISDVVDLQTELDDKQDNLIGTQDVPGLDSALSSKQDNLTDISDLPNLVSALDAKQDDLVSTADVPGLDNALNAKQDALSSPSDVPGMDAILNDKEDVSKKGTANGYASLGPDGKVPIAQLPPGQGGGASTLDELTDVTINGTPALGEILQHDGSSFVNVELSQAQKQIGDVVLSTTNPGPDWRLCNGSILLQNDHPVLFSSLGLLGKAHKDLSSLTQIGDAPGGIYAPITIDGLTVFLSDGTKIVTTEDFQNFSTFTGSTTTRALAYGNGTFVAVGDNKATCTSTDGYNWTEHTSVPNLESRHSSLEFYDGRFFTLRDYLLESTDGIRWIRRSQFVAPSRTWISRNGCEWIVGAYFSGSGAGDIHRSLDGGENWQVFSAPLDDAGNLTKIYHAAYFQGRWFICTNGDPTQNGRAIWSTIDFVSYTKLTLSQGYPTHFFNYKNEILTVRAPQSGGRTQYTTDGINFTQIYSPHGLSCLWGNNEDILLSPYSKVYIAAPVYNYDHTSEFQLPNISIKENVKAWIKAE